MNTQPHIHTKQHDNRQHESIQPMKNPSKGQNITRKHMANINTSCMQQHETMRNTEHNNTFGQKSVLYAPHTGHFNLKVLRNVLKVMYYQPLGPRMTVHIGSVLDVAITYKNTHI